MMTSQFDSTLTSLKITKLPLSLYIHIPWCLQKCPYCDFNSHALRNKSLPEDVYIDALLKDLKREAEAINNRSIETVFIGGGTPSLFSAASIERLLNGINAICTLADTAEITLEANPGTFEQNRFSDYRIAGINRLSIGVQSFNAEALQRLGRVHNGDEAIRAANIAHKANFTNINLDLMFGLPGQSLAEAKKDVEMAVSLSPSHISYYQLTLEPNTLFYVKPPTLPLDDDIWTIQTQGQELLAEAGFEQYEISAYAKPDKQCNHNLNYWQFGDYIGIGAGAHSKITSDQGIVRRIKVSHPNDYLRHADSAEQINSKKYIPENELALEFMMNALRLNRGFTSDLFSERTGLPLSAIKTSLEKAFDQGFLSKNNEKISPTSKGSLFLNDLLSIFM